MNLRSPHLIKWMLRVGLPSLVTVALFAIVIFAVVMPAFKNSLLERKEDSLKTIAETGWSILQSLHEQELAGLLTTEEAQSRAAERIRSIRYGPKMKDYLWINDMQPAIIMHPYRTDLEGQDVSDFADPHGKHLFVAFVDMVRDHQSGFVDYMWQWKDDPHRIEPKLSFVKGFKPWGWIIGTGLYVDDVAAEIRAITHRVIALCSTVLIVVIAMSVIIALYSLAAEASRTEAEGRFRALFNSTPQCIALLRTNGTIVEANRATVESLGLPHEKLLGRPLTETTWWNHSPEETAKLKNAIDLGCQGKSSRFEAINAVHNDKTITVDASITPIVNENANVSLLILESRDITERKLQEEELARHRDHLEEMVEEQVAEVRSSQARFRDVVLCSADWIWELDVKGRYTFVSAGVERILGYAPEEMLGRSLVDFIHRSEQERIANVYDEYVATMSFIDEYETLHTSRDGREVFVLTTGKPVFNESNALVGYRGVSKDITERKRSETALRESEKRFRNLYNNSVVCMLRASASDGKIVEVNDVGVQMFGYDSRGEFLQEFTLDLQLKPAGTKQTTLGSLLDQHNRVSSFETQMTRKTGELFWAELNLVSYCAEGHIEGVIQDISERKQAEAELTQAQQELVNASRRAGMSEIASGVLHNVGNVLNSVNVSADLVAEQVRKSKLTKLQSAGELVAKHSDNLAGFLTNDPQGKHFLRFIIELGKHLTRDQEDILAALDDLRKNIDHIKQVVRTQQSYARVGGVEESVYLPELIEDALRMKASSLGRVNINIVKEYDDVPPIQLDKHRTIQILLNLIGNAKHAITDYCRDNGCMTLRIKRRPESETIAIQVKDNGVGISKESLTRIFSHGFTTKREGHGFGLHSSALTAGELGGSLSVHSDGLGTGATFTLEVPERPSSKEVLR